MIYKYIQGTKDVTLLLLHGTGGTEDDLVSIAKYIDSSANFLAVRGNVIENNMNRYFRRLSEGVFDEEDLVFRTNELNSFVDEMSQKYSFDRSKVIAIGYSNGANIAASMLFHIENSLNAAILYHPMVPRRGVKLPNLVDKYIFVGAGNNDPICKPSETNDLVSLLEKSNAIVSLYWGNSGHRITNEEIDKSKDFYQNKMNK